MLRMQTFALVALGLAATAMAANAQAPQRTSPQSVFPEVFIEHVTVLPMAAAGPEKLSDVNVVIRDGRIASIAPAAATSAPKGAKRVDGRGKWLMPGLTDMHVHTPNDRMMRLYLRDPTLRDGTMRSEDIFALYIANGVLQVLDLQSMSETVGQRVAIESGHMLGPHLALAAMIDGSPPLWPVGMTRVATTPEDGRQTVRDISAEGYDFVKVYSRLDLDTFTAIVDEARRLKMRVVGHIPQRGKGITDKFFQPGYDLVAHAEEFAQQTNPPAPDAIPRYVEMTKRNGTWLIATLSLDERLLEETSHPETLRNRAELRYLPPPFYAAVVEHNPYVAQANPGYIQYLERTVQFNRELVRAFTAAGIPIVAGTDSPVPGLVPGFALHDELEAMAAAGMSHRQVLEATTRLAYQWLGVAGDRGSVEAGKRADLVLLDADPLENVANTRKIAAVIVGGRYLPRADLNEMLQTVLKHNAAGATGAAGATAR